MHKCVSDNLWQMSLVRHAKLLELCKLSSRLTSHLQLTSQVTLHGFVQFEDNTIVIGFAKTIPIGTKTEIQFMA